MNKDFEKCMIDALNDFGDELSPRLDAEKFYVLRKDESDVDYPVFCVDFIHETRKELETLIEFKLNPFDTVVYLPDYMACVEYEDIMAISKRYCERMDGLRALFLYDYF